MLAAFRANYCNMVVHITTTCYRDRFLYSKAKRRVAHSVFFCGAGREGSDLCCRLWHQGAGEGNMGAQVDVKKVKKIF
jgi:hypothetical protein